MSYDAVLPKAKRIESLLRKLGYSGKGIHELVTSAGDDLPRNVSRAARKVASIRNKVVHEADFVLNDDDLASFLESAEFVIRELDDIWECRQPRNSSSSEESQHRSPAPDTGSDYWDTAKKVGAVAGTVILAVAAIFFATYK
ncbi:hypothetical protein [Pandoraea captiosa]|uniref:hypothetical protein n=1 Tax=Pandoraea captiosa TaxID=2508302 RepID=UPI001240AE87|nr:hypothetical protein [Pandoraea captiosa]